MTTIDAIPFEPDRFSAYGYSPALGIGDLLFVFDIEPLWQPLFQGVVLLASVSIGATRLIGVRNRLDLFG